MSLLKCNNHFNKCNMIRHQSMVLILLIMSVSSVISCGPAIRTDRDTLFQTSTIGALMEGVYDGNMTVRDLKPYGDFGLGTFQSLDGEMLELDGQFYQARVDGSIINVSDNIKIPFAVVTFFDEDQVVHMNTQMDLNQFQSYIDSQLLSENVFYAIKIVGKFGYVKTRSVPAQEKPYLPLTEAVKQQQIREFHDVEGTMIGFRCPVYIDGVNVPGYHFHFIDQARRLGRHVLDISTSNVRVAIDSTLSFVMKLPDTEDFNTANLVNTAPESLSQVEKGK